MLKKDALFGGVLAIALVLTSVGSAFADAVDPADPAPAKTVTQSDAQQVSLQSSDTTTTDSTEEESKKQQTKSEDSKKHDDDKKYDDDKKHDDDKKYDDDKKHEKTKLKLVKVVYNKHGGEAKPADFTLQARNGSGPWKTYAQNTWLEVQPGSYELRESGPDGYELVSLTCTDSPKTSVDKPRVKLSKGETTTCTFTNKDEKKPLHKTAKLKLIKAVENNHGGTAEPGDWNLQIQVDGTWQTVTQNSWVVLPVGTYQIRETGGPAGYEQKSLVCTSGLSGTKVTLTKDAKVTCTFTNNDTKHPPQDGEVKLIKIVENPYDGTAVPGDWDLVLRSGDVGEILPQNTWVTVAPGDYEVYEQNGPAGYTQTDLTCENTADPSADAQSQASFTVAAGDRWVCTFTNTQNPTPPPTVDVGIEKTHSSLAGGAVEPGQTFEYLLTVTNHGTGTAYDAVVTDPIPAQLTVDDVILPTGWTGGVVDGLLTVTVPQLDAGAFGTVELVVTVQESGSEFIGSLVNEACVAVEGDTDPLNDCSTVTIPVDELIADVWVTCVNDAPYLHYSVLTSESLQGEPITLTWMPDTNVPTPVPASIERTLQSGDTGRITWPGAAFASNGVSIDWPGYRPLMESDYDAATGALLVDPSLVYNGMVRDTSDPSYPWRLGTTVTISVNPTAAFQVEYPPPSENCAVPRDAGLDIQKTASVTTTAPGESFDYGIAVRNVSVDSAADPVVLTDPIPASLRVDSISTSTTAFPRWRDCEVTGTDAAGYGGTLTCTLLGPLMMGQSAPTVTLGVTVSEKTTASKIVNVAQVCWGNEPNGELIGCNADDVTVSVAGFNVLPVTGGGDNGIAATLLGVLAILGGALLMTYGPLRRRRGGIPDRII